MNILSFELTMPNCGSWNGVWTGAKNLHFVFRKVEKKVVDRVLNGKEEANFYYRWDDGWGANIQVKKCDSATATKIKKKSNGIMGYDWMVDSIIKNGKIIIEKD